MSVNILKNEKMKRKTKKAIEELNRILELDRAAISELCLKHRVKCNTRLETDKRVQVREDGVGILGVINALLYPDVIAAVIDKNDDELEISEFKLHGRQSEQKQNKKTKLQKAEEKLRALDEWLILNNATCLTEDDTYESVKEKIIQNQNFEIAIALDPAVNGGKVLIDETELKELRRLANKNES